MNDRMIFLDHNSTTPVAPEVLAEMQRVQASAWANPSSVHAAGRAAKKVLEEARGRVAAQLGCDPGEVYFTSGGTESDHLALKGYFHAHPSAPRGIVVSTMEHPAVLSAADDLKAFGAEVTTVPCDGTGVVTAEALREAIGDTVQLVSVMAANNETGVIQPIADLAAAAHDAKAAFHSDAVQAMGKISVPVREWNVDLLSLTAHKFYGPRGVGVLYIKRGTGLTPQITGGSQERKRRAGTENVVGAWGLAVALDMACEMMTGEERRLRELSDYLLDRMQTEIEGVYVNGDAKNRLANTVNVSFAGVEGESVVVSLDLKSILISSGSACSSGATEPSHAILALGVDHNRAAGAVRVSLGRATTREDVDRLLAELPPIVARLRSLSPSYTAGS